MSKTEEPKKRPYVFLDRDGTLIVDKNYLKDPDGIEFLPEAISGLKILRAMGFGLIIITNQSGLARGYFTQEQLDAVHARLLYLLNSKDVIIDGLYYCPHAPDDHCHCRKPATGLLEAACRDFAVDLAHSVMIGDSPVDVNLGKNFGIKTIQIRSDKFQAAGADAVADTLLEAARLIDSHLRPDAP